MTTLQQTVKGDVFLVDDDVAVRRGVAALLTAADYHVTVFKSAEEFLSALNSLDRARAVLLVDVCMPGIQGLELQERLKEQGVELPCVVMTAHGDIPMAVRAMRNGATDFLEKPFTVDEVTAALDRALTLPQEIAIAPHRLPAEWPENLAKLTPRELEVFRGIVDGATNKEIARTLDVSPRTIEVHRHKIMLKMNADSFAELVRMAVALNVDGH